MKTYLTDYLKFRWYAGGAHRPTMIVMMFFFVFLLTACATPQKVQQIPYKDARYARLGEIGMPVVMKMDPANVKQYKLGIIKHGKINAFIDKNRLIVFHSRNFDVFSDEELQCIFAHEIAHAVLGHYEKRVTASVAVTGAFLVIDAFVPGAGFLNHVVNPVTTNYFSRDQERAADKLAIVHLEEIGIDKAVYADMLKKIMALEPKNSKGGGLWDSHPSMVERVELIEKMPDD